MGLFTSQKKPLVAEKTVGDVVVLTPLRDLLDERVCEELERCLQDLDEKGDQRLVVNMGKIKRTAMRGVSIIVSGYSGYRKRGARLVLCCIRDQFHFILKVSKLLEIIKIYDTEENAIRSFDAKQEGS